MSKVSITRSLLDDLAMSISAKSGEAVPLTLTEMKDAVDSISGGGTTIDPLSVTANGTYTAQSGHAYSPVTVSVPTPTLQSKTYNVSSAGTSTVTADSGYDGLSSVQVSVPNYSFGVHSDSIEVDSEDWLLTRTYPNQTSGYLSEIDGFYVNLDVENKTVNPSVSSQTVTPTDETCYLNSVTVNAMPTGTAGTPTASKGTVSNHQVSVTPSVTNTTGYITGGTKNGTAVTVSASELVSGTYTVSASGTHDVTNYASASVASGSATASATKGTVSNHSVTVTPSVTRTAGYITAGSANGTAVTVSASELVSGSETKTANGTYDVTNLASLVVDIDFVTYYTGTTVPSTLADGDIFLKVVS